MMMLFLGAGRCCAAAAATAAVVLLLLPCAASLPILDGTSGGDVDYEVFLVPHSHCDPVWKSGYLQYYDMAVRGILQAVVSVLWRAPARRFTWADISFLALWMAREGEKNSTLAFSARLQATAGWNMSKIGERAGAATWRQAFQELVHSGQIEVVHGGWVQHDEGLSSLSDTIDLMDLGRKYMESLLGQRTQVAWQIDTFGHTSTTPALLRRLGYRAVFLTRVPQIAMQKLRSHARLEGTWGRQCALSETRGGPIFVHIPFDGTYAFPQGFDYETMRDSSSLEGQTQRLLAHVRRVAAGFPSRKIMLMWGDDMRYRSRSGAASQFRMGELLMNSINSKPHLKMRVRWATPSEYLDHAHPSVLAGRTVGAPPPSARVPLEEVDEDMSDDSSGDALPYNDDKDVAGVVSLGFVWDNYWSGYYGTRPLLKSAARLVDSARRSTNHLSFLLRLPALQERAASLSHSPGTPRGACEDDGGGVGKDDAATSRDIRSISVKSSASSLRSPTPSSWAFRELVEEALMNLTASTADPKTSRPAETGSVGGGGSRRAGVVGEWWRRGLTRSEAVAMVAARVASATLNHHDSITGVCVCVCVCVCVFARARAWREGGKEIGGREGRREGESV